jgi:hypothetical protein
MSAPTPRRRLDKAILGLSGVTAVVFLLLWTGWVPVLYGPNPTGWNLLIPGCPTALEHSPSVQHTFPMWAKVTISWRSSGTIVFWLFGPEDGVENDAIGQAGNYSYASNANPIVIAPSALPGNSSCTAIYVQISAQFTV